jgi:hypothetical protein
MIIPLPLWKDGYSGYEKWNNGQYVYGHRGKGHNLQLDGDFTSEELRALADWMDSDAQHSDSR